MELILQQGLPHQQRAVDAVCDALKGIYLTKPQQFYANPTFNQQDGHIKRNIQVLQRDLPAEYRSEPSLKSKPYLNLDIKMETGTGKTYVYTKTIYELHKRYGFNKFIIAVPSLAIKAGTAQFLMDSYAKKHFADSCGYAAEIEPLILESPKNKKKGRSYFPSVVGDFVKGSYQVSNKIYVLLVNMQLLTNAKVLTREDYDYGVEGFYEPTKALAATRPIVMLDEPHRFSREQKAFKFIEEKLNPQIIIRYGATFPEKTSGRGKNKITVKDYQNLLYDLNACASFNQGLIKGVAKEHFKPLSNKDAKVKITSIENKEAVHLQYKQKDEPTKSYELKKGDSLAIVDNAFEGVTITAIGRSKVEFSNGIEKSTGEELDVDIYMTSYQEQMLRLALQRHFETERKNFCDRKYRIKTLALFFIDDITSYRADEEGKEPYLRLAFERLLKEQLEKTIASLNEHEGDYKKYLQDSLADLSACHAVYFAQDNNDSDEEIAKEVATILHGKKELLSFTKKDGSANTLRFLFSKWTLKEGWDNPNVFTIAKLRSSGSDNSKLQEVGRGLRLPVDENGNRIANEEFTLNYIVDFTEADFAQKLVNQINGEIPQVSVISDDKLVRVAAKLGMLPDELFGELFCKKHYIDRHYNINPITRAQFFEEYPDFAVGLKAGKVRDRNTEKPKPVKIRKAVYQEIKELWETINYRYLMFYDNELNEHIEDVVLSIFESRTVFSSFVVTSERTRIASTGTVMHLVGETGAQYVMQKKIPYGLFLKRISAATNLPITVLHSALCRYEKKHGMGFTSYINDNSVAAFCTEFAAWKAENLQGRFKYERSKAPLGATAY